MLLCAMPLMDLAVLPWCRHHRQDPTTGSAMASQDGSEMLASAGGCGNMSHIQLVWSTGTEASWDVWSPDNSVVPVGQL